MNLRPTPDAIERLVGDDRADLVLVDPGPTPTVDRAFVAGTEVYRTAPGDRHAPEDSTRTRP